MKARSIGELGEEIKKITNQLIVTVVEIDTLEETLSERLYNEEQEAHEILSAAVKKANQVFLKVGLRLNEIGSLQLMQSVFYSVPNNKPISLINLAWNQVGEWES